MLVAVHPGLEATPAIADAVEHEHPPAPEPERVPGPGVAIHGVEDPRAESEQREPDDPTHDRVQPVGEERAERERGDPEGDDHRTVTQRVQRAQPDGLDLVGREERTSRSGGRHRGERGGAGPGVVGADLVPTAVIVVVAGDQAVLLQVRGLGDTGGRGRAGDVRDRGDVIPVDPVADPQEQPRDEDAERGGVDERCGTQIHAAPPRPSSLPDAVHVLQHVALTTAISVDGYSRPVT